MADSPYTLTLQERDPPKHQVTVRLGDKPPTPAVEGEGGWETVALPKRSAVVIWRGRGLLKMIIPVVFDGVITGHALPAGYATLLGMWRPYKEPTEEPPVLEVSSLGDVVPYLAEIGEWLLSDIAWEDAVGDERGFRQQQKLTLTLLEYRADERLMTAAAKKGRRRHKPRTYTVRRRDLAAGLKGIAEYLHVKGGWEALGALQHPKIRDPRKIKVGQVLVLPHTESSKPR